MARMEVMRNGHTYELLIPIWLSRIGCSERHFGVNEILFYFLGTFFLFVPCLWVLVPELLLLTIYIDAAEWPPNVLETVFHAFKQDIEAFFRRIHQLQELLNFLAL